MGGERDPLINSVNETGFASRKAVLILSAVAACSLLLALASHAGGSEVVLLQSSDSIYGTARSGSQVRQGRMQILTHWEPMPTRLGMKCCGSNGCGCGAPATPEEAADDDEDEEHDGEEHAPAQEEGDGSGEMDARSEEELRAQLDANPLTRWQEDATVNQGTYEQQDESATLIYPWARNSHAYDPRDHPDDLFDDDAPRERR
jgi:hypothetical protein